MEMCILSRINVKTKIVEMTAVESLSFFLVSCVVPNSSLTSSRVVMKLNGVLDYHIGMCIFSEIFVWAKIVEMTAVDLGVFCKTLSCVVGNSSKTCRIVM